MNKKLFKKLVESIKQATKIRKNKMKCERCSIKDQCPYIYPDGLECYLNCPILENRLFVSAYKLKEEKENEPT